MIIESSWLFSKNSKISNFRKFRPVGAELFYVDSLVDRRTERQMDKWSDRRMDRWTDMTKLRVALSNFSNTSKTACHTVKQINTLYKKMQNFLVLNYTVN